MSEAWGIRWSRARLAVLTAFVAGAAVAGCGTGRTLNSSSVSRQVNDTLVTRLGPPAPSVHCPGGISASAGTHFRCSADVDGQTLSVAGTVIADRRITLSLNEAVISTAQAERALSLDLWRQFGAPVTVTCGHHGLLVIRRSFTVTCTATGGGTTRPVTVRTTDSTGGISYVLGAATAAPTSKSVPPPPPPTLVPPPTEPPPSTAGSAS